MSIKKENYRKLETLLNGRSLPVNGRQDFSRPGYQDIYLIHRGEDRYSLVNNFDYGGQVLLSDPEIGLRVDVPQREVHVLFQEDHFHHEGSKPVRRYFDVYPNGAHDESVDREVSHYLGGWLDTLIGLGFEPVDSPKSA